jgi:hypothetical protein
MQFNFDFDTKIEFANIRQAKVLKLEYLKNKAIESFRQRYAEDSESVALGFALKLSISGSNLDRMVPMIVAGHEVSSETFRTCVKPQRGQDVPEDVLTVSRFCASMANEISQYLEKHPDQVRNTVANISAKLSFPHNYYIVGLSNEEKDACIVWLNDHDRIMNQATSGRWRPLALKAAAYFSAQSA